MQLGRVRTHMQTYVDQGRLAGIQTLLSRRDTVCYFESQGWRNVENALPIQADTIFRIYSMTKPIVSVAAMILVEEGRLRLSDPVSEYLPPFARVQVYADERTRQPPRRPVLVHDLLTHTSGLSYGFLDSHPVDALYQQRGLPSNDHRSNDEFIESLCAIPLAFHPGAAWRYSVATDVLGVVIAAIAGSSLAAFLQARIFDPLGMVDTGFKVPASSQERLAACYENAETGTLALAPHLMPDRDPFLRDTFQSGGGGLASTCADYLQFCRLLLHKGTLEGERILGRKTVELMTMNHLPPSLLPFGIRPGDFDGYGFGLGFRVLMNPAAPKRLAGAGEYGWAGAADTYFWIDPAEELIGLFLAQLMPSGVHGAARSFQSLAYAALQD